MVVVCDASVGNADEAARTQGGRAVLLMEETGDPAAGGPACVVESRSGKMRRVAHASFDGECLVAVEAIDAGLGVSMLVREWELGPMPSLYERHVLAIEGVPYHERHVVMDVHTDSQCLTRRVESRKVDTKIDKRRRQDVSDIKECIERGCLRALVKVLGLTNPTDPLTKPDPSKEAVAALNRLLYSGRYEPDTRNPADIKSKNTNLVLCTCGLCT